MPTADLGLADLLRIRQAGGPELLDAAAALLGLRRGDRRQATAREETQTERGPSGGPEKAFAVQPDALAAASIEPMPTLAVWMPTAYRLLAQPHERETTPQREAPTPELPAPVPFPHWPNRPPPARQAPLNAWPALLPRLRGALGAARSTRAPDVGRIVARLSRGEILERVPYQATRRWGAPVQILDDRSRHLVPYWRDQGAVRRALQDLFPAHARVVGVIDEALALSPEMCRPSHRGNGYAPPPPGGVLVVLGDLGVLANSGAQALAFWQALGRRVRQVGARAAALVPYAPLTAPAALREHWTLIPWERDAVRLTPEARAAQVAQLLDALAVSVRVEPGLLRDVRRFLDMDCSVEAAFWQHPALIGRSSVAATIDGRVLKQRRSAFDALELPVRRALWHRQLAWRAGLDDAVLFSEAAQLSSASDALLDDAQRAALLRFFAALDARVAQGGELPEAVAAWFRRLEGRALKREPIWHTAPVHRLWAAVHADDDGGEPPPSFDLSNIAPDPAAGELTIALAQRGAQLLVSSIDPSSSSAAGAVADPPSAVALASPLGRLTSHNRWLAAEPITHDRDPAFWESGEAPPWATRWGWDDYGAWVAFEVERSDAEPVRQRMRWIEPGSFLMGSPEGEEGRWENEGPQHAVRIEQGYWLFDTPCTQALWEAVTGKNPSSFAGPIRPVEVVSWEDIEGFLGAVNERVPGLDLGLPSEAQWEYACRAGSEARWCFGDDEAELGEYAWFSANADRQTQPVAQKRPNAWGLYDCHGNVFEWVRDPRHESYEGAPTDGTPWDDPEGWWSRGIRGGSWNYPALLCRSAYRGRHAVGDRYFDLGFRCARVQVRELGSGSGGAERSDRPRAVPARGSGSGRDGAGPYRGAGGADGERLGDTPPETPSSTGTTLRLHADEGARIVLPDAPALVLRTDRDELTLRRLTKPGWADATGRDRFGLWADLRIESSNGAPVIQRLRWIPPGRFQMGSPNDEPGHRSLEAPLHEVEIGHGFWLFDSPCTQALWEVVIGEHGSRFRDPQRPVENVSWEDAQRFVFALQERLAALGDDGGRIVLPSEAQWEYACRAGSETALYNGPIEIQGNIRQSLDAPRLDQIAWYGGNSGFEYDLYEGDDTEQGWWADKQKQYAHTRAGTRKVKGKQPNAWGLYDMLGNVWEWTLDHWHDNYDGAPADGRPWIDGDLDASGDRMFRGGSWSDTAQRCRSAHRGAGTPRAQYSSLGFRCARVQA